MHGILATAPYAAGLFFASAAFIWWKAKGGNLLFRFKRTDDASTTFMKAVLYLGWTYGSLLIAISTAFVSACWLVIALLVGALGG